MVLISDLSRVPTIEDGFILLILSLMLIFLESNSMHRILDTVHPCVADLETFL